MHADRQKRVYYHETRDVCDGLPDLLHRFPLRALMVARKGERVVLPAGQEPHELELLNRLGFGPSPEDIIYVRDDGTIASGDRDLAGAELLPFSGVTTLARDFADRHGLRFVAPSRDICVAANSKAVFQRAAETLRERGQQVAPRGIVTDRAGIPDAVAAMLVSCERVIVKGVASASGLQQTEIARGEKFGPEDCGELPEEVVVQEWFRHDFSPSLHCVLSPNGVTKTLYASRQLLEGRHHVGNVFYGNEDTDIPAWAWEQMRKIAQAISRAYSGTILADSERSVGYWGPLGIDYMVDGLRRKVLAAEVNARIAAPWYAWRSIRSRYGTSLPFRTRSYRLREKVTVADIADAMGQHLFTFRRMHGFVPYCFVPEHGFVYGSTYAMNRIDLEEFSARSDAVMAELAP